MSTTDNRNEPGYRRIHAVALGVGIGVVESLAIAIGTAILVMQGEGGEAFLGHFIPFYEITWNGVFIGGVAGFVDGFVGGVLLGWVYNRAVSLLDGPTGG